MDDLRRSFGEVKVCGVGLLSLHARYPELLQRVFLMDKGIIDKGKLISQMHLQYTLTYMKKAEIPCANVLGTSLDSTLMSSPEVIHVPYNAHTDLN